MIKYKLTTQDMTTFGQHKWELGVTQTIHKPGAKLCTNQVFHFYDSPELTVLLNPIHADILKPRLFEVECDQVAHDGLKGGSKSMTLLQELPLPVYTTTQRVAFGILCAKAVYKDPPFAAWADGWLNNTDCSEKAARVACARASAAARAAQVAAGASAAAWAAAGASAAAWAAAQAAWEAEVGAAQAAWEAWEAEVGAAQAAWEAEVGAAQAAQAAWAVRNEQNINLSALAIKALDY